MGLTWPSLSNTQSFNGLNLKTPLQSKCPTVPSLLLKSWNTRSSGTAQLIFARPAWCLQPRMDLSMGQMLCRDLEWAQVLQAVGSEAAQLYHRPAVPPRSISQQRGLSSPGQKKLVSWGVPAPLPEQCVLYGIMLPACQACSHLTAHKCPESSL